MCCIILERFIGLKVRVSKSYICPLRYKFYHYLLYYHIILLTTEPVFWIIIYSFIQHLLRTSRHIKMKKFIIP